MRRYEKYFPIRKTRKVAIGSLGNTKYIRGMENFDRATFDHHLTLSDSKDVRFDLEKIYAEQFCNIMGSWMFFVSRNFAIQRSFFENLKGFDERFIGWGSEDTEFAYRIAKNGEKFDLLDIKNFHISSGIPSNANHSSGNRYFEWLVNVGFFYDSHNDPAILLLLLNEKVIYDCFCTGKSWSDKDI